MSMRAALIIPNIRKNVEFRKEAAQIFGLERETIAGGQGTSEDQKFVAKPTRQNSTFFLIFGIICISASVCHASPQDPVVVSGEAAFQQSAQELKVTTSERAIIHWKDFSIGANETTRFIQPHASSIVLNRVTGGIPSNIFGILEANGKVFLVNPNGILIGKDAAINVGAFIASTLDFSDHDFLMRRDLLFQGGSQEAIVNLGTITAWDGDVMLLARVVDNQGAISAVRGTAALAGGSEILLKPTGHEKIFIRAKANSSTEVNSSGNINALQIELKADGNPYGHAINHSGVAEAVSLVERQGKVFLVAEKGSVKNTGSITTNGDEFIVHARSITAGDSSTKSKGSFSVQSDLPASLTIHAIDEILIDDGFSIALQNGTLTLETDVGDILINSYVKHTDGLVHIRAGQDLKIGSGQQLTHSRIESQNGNVSLYAGRDLYLLGSEKRAALVNTHGATSQLTVLAERDALLMGGKESAAKVYVFSKGDLSFLTGRHLTMDSVGPNYAAIGAAQNVTVVVDNAFPTPPLVGPGALYMGPSSRMQGGTLKIFAAKQSNNTIQGALNLVPFLPSAEYSSSAEEVWGSYFYSGVGGVPFTIFYKDVWMSSRVTDLFDTAVTEFLDDLKYFDEFHYLRKNFWLRYDRPAYDKVRLPGTTSSPEVVPDRIYRMLQEIYKNCDGNLGKLL